jgi:hypothetical protein
MEQSPPWEAGRSSDTQEIPRILWNPEIHHRIHNSPPPVPLLNHIDPVYDDPPPPPITYITYVIIMLTLFQTTEVPLLKSKAVIYKVVQIWPGQIVTCLHTNSPGHIWTTLYLPLSCYLSSLRSKYFPQLRPSNILCVLIKYQNELNNTNSEVPLNPSIRSTILNFLSLGGSSESPQMSSLNSSLLDVRLSTRWFKYDRDWFVSKQAALRSGCATLREWSHNLYPPSCSG